MTYDPNVQATYVGRVKLGDDIKYTPKFRHADDVTDWIVPMVYGLGDANLATEWLVIRTFEGEKSVVVRRLTFTTNVDGAVLDDQRRGWRASVKYVRCPCCEEKKENCRYKLARSA